MTESIPTPDAQKHGQFELPAEFEPPREYQSPNFRFEVLGPQHAEADYEAVQTNKEFIATTRGTDPVPEGSDEAGWPLVEMSYEENEGDLARHHEQFEQREAFAYAIRGIDGGEYLGCFYLYPPGHFSADSAMVDVEINYWVTKSAAERGLYEQARADIETFITNEWPMFASMHFVNTR